MNTNLSSSAPAQVETECLVAVVLDRSEKDRGEKDKPVVEVASSDTALRNAAQEVIASGARMDHISDMHDRMLVVVHTEDADPLRQRLEANLVETQAAGRA